MHVCFTQKILLTVEVQFLESNYILGVVLYMAKATKYIDTLFNNVEKKIKGVQMVVTYRCVPIMHLEGNFKSDLSCQDLMMSSAPRPGKIVGRFFFYYRIQAPGQEKSL